MQGLTGLVLLHPACCILHLGSGLLVAFAEKEIETGMPLPQNYDHPSVN